MKRITALLLIGIITACGQSGDAGNQNGIQNGNNDSQTGLVGNQKQTGGEIIHLRKHSVVDNTGIGMEAYSFLVPKDWTVDAKVYWSYDNPGMPSNSYVRAWSPDGSLLFEVSPVVPFFWTNSQFSLSFNPPGSKYSGHTVAQPMNAVQSLQNIALPYYRQGYQNLQVSEQKNLPGLVSSLIKNQQSYPGISYTADGGMLKLNYIRNGVSFEEEFYGIVEVSSSQIPDMYQGTVTSSFWYLGYMFSFAAVQGKLEANRKLFETIVNSFKINLQWFNKYQQVVNLLINQQMQSIYQAGQISRIISQTNNEISQMINDSYWQRQEVNDRIAENFSQSIRGTANFNDEGNTVELPNTYSDVWSNGVGEYIMSNETQFDPNKTLGGNWQIIKPQN